MNSLIIICIVSWAVAQLTKVFLVLARDKRLDLRYLFSSGGMPSSHSATVTALATGVAIEQGLGSVAFAISAILAIVVMYDAAGVRQAVGRQAIVLNRIVRELREKRTKDEMERDLRELVGHTPFQVIAGGIMGALIAWLWLTAAR
ncbi:MAG: divergent PAP2 family protein [Chloroflexi bacterium]|nr:divergent PAP2 family protein [Chloroflexota bacterium]